MIQIRQVQIEEIPVLVIQDQQRDSGHWIVVYHGWTHSKDEDIVIGIELAKKGLNVLMPDVVGHGSRPQIPNHPLLFPNLLLQSQKEFQQIEAYLKSEEDLESLSLAGISMGSIIANMIASQRKDLTVLGQLMGTNQLLDFIRYLGEKYKLDPSIIDSEAYIKLIESLSGYDLSKKFDVLNQTHLFIWHSQNDSVIPVNFTKQVQDYLSGVEERPSYQLTIDPIGGHSLPYRIIQDFANFTYKSIKVKNNLTFPDL